MEHLLTVFIAVTEHGSFTKAGSYLHLTQPTVTASIKQLERKYNAVLLDRTNKYVRLTKSGEVVYHYAKKMQQYQIKMENVLADMHQNAAGTVTIGASYTYGEYMLPAVIAKLRATYPNITPVITIQNSENILDLLAHNQLDIGIIEKKLTNDVLTIQPFQNDELVCVFPTDHPALQKKPLLPADLTKEDWIIREEGSGTREMQMAFLEREAIRLEKTPLVFSSTQPIKEAIKLGLGISLLSRLSIQAELASGEFLMIQDPAFTISRSFSLVKNKNDYPLKITELVEAIIYSMAN